MVADVVVTLTAPAEVGLQQPIRLRVDVRNAGERSLEVPNLAIGTAAPRFLVRSAGDEEGAATWSVTPRDEQVRVQGPLIARAEQPGPWTLPPGAQRRASFDLLGMIGDLPAGRYVVRAEVPWGAGELSRSEEVEVSVRALPVTTVAAFTGAEDRGAADRALVTWGEGHAVALVPRNLDPEGPPLTESRCDLGIQQPLGKGAPRASASFAPGGARDEHRLVWWADVEGAASVVHASGRGELRRGRSGPLGLVDAVVLPAPGQGVLTTEWQEVQGVRASVHTLSGRALVAGRTGEELAVVRLSWSGAALEASPHLVLPRGARCLRHLASPEEDLLVFAAEGQVLGWRWAAADSAPDDDPQVLHELASGAAGAPGATVLDVAATALQDDEGAPIGSRVGVLAAAPPDPLAVPRSDPRLTVHVVRLSGDEVTPEATLDLGASLGGGDLRLFLPPEGIEPYLLGRAGPAYVVIGATGSVLSLEAGGDDLAAWLGFTAAGRVFLVRVLPSEGVVVAPLDAD